MKKVRTWLIVILAFVLALLLWRERRSEQEQNAYYASMETELRPLNIKRRELTDQLTKLEESHEQKIVEAGCATVLFTGMDEFVYTDIYPIMKEDGFPGVLALSGTQFPGEPGCMSMEQFRELSDAGWSYCVIWQGENYEDWLTPLAERMANAQLVLPAVMYFPDNTYSAGYDDQLAERGFSIAVHHGEEEKALVVYETEEGIWHPGAVGLQGEDPRYRLEEAVNGEGNIIFTVGSETEEEKYEEEPFRSMLSYFRTYKEGGSLLVTDLENARNYQIELAEERNRREESYRKERTELEEEMVQITAQIDSVYAKYLR